MSLRLVGMTMLYFFSNESSKTIRTRRSLENVLFSESSSILVSRKRNKQIDMRDIRPQRQDVFEDLFEERKRFLDYARNDKVG